MSGRPGACENVTVTKSATASGDSTARLVAALRSWGEGFGDWDRDHRYVTDSVIALALFMVSVLFPYKYGVERAENYVFQIALVAPLIWRRRAPSLVFVVIALVALLQWLIADPVLADAALLVALFTLAVHAPARRAVAGAVVLSAGVLMASVRWAPAGDVAKSLLFLNGLVVAALCAGIALRSSLRYVEAQAERTAQLELERDQQALLAAAAERARIAREMHDVVAHNVSIMVTLADGALAAADSHPDRAKEAMADVSATGRLALTDMRRLLGVLRAEEETGRQPQPQLAGLPELVHGVRSTGLAVEFDEDGVPFTLPSGVELTIFRIVQESLTNVLKHADEASSARVTLVYDEPFVDITIRDDGKPTQRGDEGHGLLGMRERATTCGGELSAGPTLEGGWKVAARVRVDA